MKKISRILSIAFFTLAVTLCSTTVYADDPDGFEDEPQDVPIDGGVSLLVAAGVGYGAKKLHEARRKKSKDQTDDHTTK